MSQVTLAAPGHAAWWRSLALGWWCMGAGVAAMAASTVLHLAQRIWAHEEQSYGAIILAVCLWLIWQKREALAAAPSRPAPLAAALCCLLAVTAYVLGRSQDTITLEALGPIGAGVSWVLLIGGWPALRVLAVPVVCLLFVVPLPGVLVQALTVPLKLAVSWMAEQGLYAAGYPIARTGVILAIDQYQLLVADACAGLSSMFTLEAMGLLYLDRRGYTSHLRNGLLAVLLIPIALISNVIRVVILVLVTYYLGDAVGQGFVHGAAGIVLFVVAMLLMLGVDALLGRWLPGARSGR